MRARLRKTTAVLFATTKLEPRKHARAKGSSELREFHEHFNRGRWNGCSSFFFPRVGRTYSFVKFSTTH